MTQNDYPQEQLDQKDPELTKEAEPIQAQEENVYVERPRSSRIFAWVLLILVVIGVILYYLWIAGVLHE